MYMSSSTIFYITKCMHCTNSYYLCSAYILKNKKRKRIGLREKEEEKEEDQMEGSRRLICFLK